MVVRQITSQLVIAQGKVNEHTGCLLVLGVELLATGMRPCVCHTPDQKAAHQLGFGQSSNDTEWVCHEIAHSLAD